MCRSNIIIIIVVVITIVIIIRWTYPAQEARPQSTIGTTIALLLQGSLFSQTWRWWWWWHNFWRDYCPLRHGGHRHFLIILHPVQIWSNFQFTNTFWSRAWKGGSFNYTGGWRRREERYWGEVDRYHYEDDYDEEDNSSLIMPLAEQRVLMVCMKGAK